MQIRDGGAHPAAVADGMFRGPKTFWRRAIMIVAIGIASLLSGFDPRPLARVADLRARPPA
jgi:hypothetical protein